MASYDQPLMKAISVSGETIPVIGMGTGSKRALTAYKYRLLIMKEITGINHVGLRVRDLDISREFYEKLGFKFIVGPVGPEPVAIVEHPSGVNFNLILNASDDAPRKNILMEESVKYPGYTHIALEITDAA